MITSRKTTPRFMTPAQVRRLLKSHFRGILLPANSVLRKISDRLHKYPKGSILVLGEKGFPNKVFHAILKSDDKIVYDPQIFKGAEFTEGQYTAYLPDKVVYVILQEIDIADFIESEGLHFKFNQKRIQEALNAQSG